MPELTRQRRLLVLAICCSSLFIVGLDNDGTVVRFDENVEPVAVLQPDGKATNDDAAATGEAGRIVHQVSSANTRCGRPPPRIPA